MRILTAAQMQQVDRETTARYGLPSLLLMENAGSGVVREMERHFGRLDGMRFLVVCGKGNNGGDGLVLARQLHLRKLSIQILIMTSCDKLKGNAWTNLEIAQKMGVPIQWVSEQENWQEILEGWLDPTRIDIVVDALLGTGVRLPLTGFMAGVIRSLSQFPRIVAIDLPSGLDCDLIGVMSSKMIAPMSELTVTFTAPKPAHVFLPAAKFSKKWTVVPIGIPDELVEASGSWLSYVVLKEAGKTLQRFVRRSDAHKGHFGHVLGIAGSLGKTGAACMMAQSALYSGAGLVTLAVPSPCQPIVAGQLLEVMTESLSSNEGGGVSTKAFEYSRLEGLLQGKTVVALGPGLGTATETVEFVKHFLQECRLPVVLDADGINAVKGTCELLKRRGRFLVLTPHPGEFARLLGIPTRTLLNNRIKLARDFAIKWEVYLILKGQQTILAAPSGEVYLNSTGNPGMATGGSGDVLTGIVAGMIAQWLSMPDTKDKISTRDLEAVIIMAILIHGLSGDLAREVRGEQALVASDLMTFMAKALLRARDSVSFNPTTSINSFVSRY